MKKRTAIFAALVSFLPIGQPLVMGTVSALTSSAVMLSVPERAMAESDYKYYIIRGMKKGGSGDNSGAISDFSKAIEINPRSLEAYFNRGVARSRSGDYDGAISDYSKMLEINPMNFKMNFNAYYNRGSAKRKSGDYDGAISDYSKALEINPRDKRVLVNRGISKSQMGDLKGACSDWREASSLGSERAANWVEKRGYCPKS
tara:strand:- start:973 stop:1578 length:606 start_codon:yes stop_codon:yes gene_type:complete